MITRIIMDGDPILRQRSEPVIEFAEELWATRQLMLDAISGLKARGLAAIQIGIPLRVILARVGTVERWMVNPVIVRKLNREVVWREGCLSVAPRNWCSVSRPAKCEIEWQDPLGNHNCENFSGEWACVLQHEIDHLDGILITDKRVVA